MGSYQQRRRSRGEGEERPAPRWNIRLHCSSSAYVPYESRTNMWSSSRSEESKGRCLEYYSPMGQLGSRVTLFVTVLYSGRNTCISLLLRGRLLCPYTSHCWIRPTLFLVSWWVITKASADLVSAGRAWKLTSRAMCATRPRWRRHLCRVMHMVIGTVIGNGRTNWKTAKTLKSSVRKASIVCM